MDENKSGLYIVAIVGVIAVVALVVLVTSGNKGIVYTGTSANPVGHVFASTECTGGDYCGGLEVGHACSNSKGTISGTCQSTGAGQCECKSSSSAVE